jgi:fructokinase
MQTPVSVIGEALIDIVVPVTGETAEHVGGSPANVAIGLARLGHQVELSSHFGEDERGHRIAALMAAEHIALAPGSTDAARTPTATARLDPAGVAHYEFDLDWRPAPFEVPDGGHLHTGSIGATLEPGADTVRGVVDAARAHATVSYDPNARPSLMGSPAEALARIEPLVRAADVVKASDEDLAWLYGPDTDPADVAAAWQQLGPALCLVTCGGSDVLVRIGSGTHRVATHPTTVVDTVGAGDSFMAGLLSGLLDAGLLGGCGRRPGSRCDRRSTGRCAAPRSPSRGPGRTRPPGATCSSPPAWADPGITPGRGSGRGGAPAGSSPPPGRRARPPR